MRARERQEGAGAGQGQGQEAEGEGPDLGVSPGQEGDLDLNLRRGLGQTPGILTKSQKAVQGAGRDLEVDPRAETRKEAAQSRVQDPGPGPVIKRLFGYIGILSKEFISSRLIVKLTKWSHYCKYYFHDLEVYIFK